MTNWVRILRGDTKAESWINTHGNEGAVLLSNERRIRS